jgi:large subunit ribosomal protein L29
MIIKDLLIKSPKELQELIQDLKAQLFMLRFKNSTGQQDQTHKIKEVRKDVARVFTALEIKKREEQKKPTVKKPASKKPTTKKVEVIKPVTETVVKVEDTKEQGGN